jgi:symplekin
MDGIVRDFALQMLRRLQSRPTPEAKPTDMEVNDNHDENMEDGQLPPEDIAHTPYLAEELELPATRSQVLQHLELMFALTVKVPDFLDE